MQILDLPAIPKEKKALQAIINEARHKAFLQRWLRRGILLLIVVNIWAFGCYAPGQAPRAEGATEQAQEQVHAGTTVHVHEQAQQGGQVALPLITR